MLTEQDKYYSDVVTSIVGVDEAGRGPLAGPVVAAACILPRDYKNNLINDSKQVSEKRREELFIEIKKVAIAYGICFVSAPEIDKLNIYEATKVAMQGAIEQIKVPYQLILTDAMKLDLPVEVIPLIKGDARCENIAAASILAKVSRDHYMCELEKQYPNFKFSVHKGYGTKLHLEEIEKYGPIKDVHRFTYAPVKKYFVKQLTLF